ncbi:hypothetical protein DWB68_10155 [Galactobacter valiniphilus]|uniref:Uncharacterized protein n=1 Tax=Galactobacter valiniphilus TaxID=2676122 RepID=A0A399J9X9_9MICC|nr:hypothetical protein [Galactobacter valiniphilus]RII41880.1 hypothetical protein DWB68_10155 [Galactobacter valiniphilus]
MDEQQMIRLVRRTVADPDGALFDDQAVTDALAMFAADSDAHRVKLAAADLLDQIAVSEVMVSKKITTQDLSTDGTAVSKELREHAKRLRTEVATEKAQDDPNVGFFHVIPDGASARLEGEEWSAWPR